MTKQHNGIISYVSNNLNIDIKTFRILNDIQVFAYAINFYAHAGTMFTLQTYITLLCHYVASVKLSVTVSILSCSLTKYTFFYYLVRSRQEEEW